MRDLLKLLSILSCAAASVSAATVGTDVTCGEKGNPQGGYVASSGIYDASCITTYVDRGVRTASASAHVDPGNLIVQAFTSGGNSSFEAAVADAFLSAQYLLTLTGGNNLFSDPVRGLFGEFVPCLIVNGPTTAFVTNLASLDGVSQSGTGMTCGKQSPIQIFLNAPTTMQLVLQAQSDGGTGFAASAALTGFTFFGSGNPCGSGCFGLAPLEGATFTFTLNDSLPPNLPEPGTFFLIAPPAALLLARRVRRPVP